MTVRGTIVVLVGIGLAAVALAKTPELRHWFEISSTVGQSQTDGESPLAYYAPGMDLGTVDKSIIDQASKSIDMAAYVLTDMRVIDALDKAATRGATVRIYLDHEQLIQARQRGGEANAAFNRLAANPHVVICRSLDSTGQLASESGGLVTV